MARPGKAFGTLEQVFDDVWWAWGTVHMGPGIVVPRTMAIVREGGELVVIHPVMMPPDEQAKIEALGPIKHIVRLGAGHGMDDPAYVARYKPTTWSQPGAPLREGVTRDHELVTDGPTPIAGARVIAFDNSASAECVLHVPRNGGILFACDSVQNWAEAPGMSLLAGPVSRALGFRGRACLGPRWRKRAEPKTGGGFAPTYERIAALELRHAIGGHGAPIKDTARDDLRASIQNVYGRATGSASP